MKWIYLQKWLTDDTFAKKFDPDGIQSYYGCLDDDIETQWMFDNWAEFSKQLVDDPRIRW